MEGRMKGSSMQWGRRADFPNGKGAIDKCTVRDIGLFNVLDLFLVFYL